MKTGIIYKWTNKITNEAYIGQTMHEQNRIIQHMRANKDNKFHKAIRDYGIQNFKYEVLERDIEENNLNNRERYWVTFYKTNETGYNSSHGGDCGNRHRIIKEETRDKLSKAHKGKSYGPHSEETKKKISESNKGKHSEHDWLYTEEVNKKRSESCKKYYDEHPGSHSEENNPFYGKHHNEKTRERLKAAWEKRKLKKVHRVYHEDGTYHYE